YELPRIRSERPAFELHYPHMVPRLRAEAYVGARRARSDGESAPASSSVRVGSETPADK
ncbi:hypothetical protein, partial [Mycobacterium sp.]|uniref:hypothetical protein n=1 Tax=Mycobacterium sp. TaxID=1785 RepID=UPI0025E8CB96